MRGRIKLALAMVAGAVVLSVGLLASGGAGAAGAPSTRVIVVLKNQFGFLPATRQSEAARAQAVHSAQAGLLAQLRSSGAQITHTFTLLNAVAATVSSAELAQLKSSPAVSEVVPDQVIHLSSPFPMGVPKPGSHVAGAAAAHKHKKHHKHRKHHKKHKKHKPKPKPPTPAPPQLGGIPTHTTNPCSANGQPQLNPQALETIGADSDVPGAQTARSMGLDGSGVTVGFIADGLDINNPDFIRANGQHVIVDYKDFSGEGTAVPTGGEEAFGDAASIAAQGRQTYDASAFGPNGVQSSCPIRVEGVAPGASVVALSIFGAEDAGYGSSFIQAIDYAVTVDHVNVLNESLGSNYYPDDSALLDLVKAANDAAVAAGTTVTVSSGDAGITSTIGTPATDPNVLAVGASTTYRVDLQTGYGGSQFGVKGWLDDDISSFSSSGFEQDGRTIDLVAPGELNWALCSTDTQQYSECVSYGGQPTPIYPFGGTSESAPLTAGAAALVIQAYRKTHGGATPTPQVVKQIIDSTADDIGSPADQQGAGRLDAYRAVRAAESYKTAGRIGATLLDSAPQLNAIAAPGTAETLTDTVTNNGSTTQTVALAGRKLGPYTTIKTTTVTLDDTASQQTTDWAGVPSNAEPITFTVPGGQNRLNASIAFHNASLTDLNARVRMTLIDPSGDLAGYSVPQGDGNYGNLQVTDPQPGTWTAYVWSKQSGYGGTNGPVLFGAQVAKYASFGTVTPSKLTLKPGQSGTVTLNVATPAQPGDASGAITMTASGEHTSIPVTLRSLIPMGQQSFSQALTGGNGRSLFTGVTYYYQLHVPAGQPELNASVKLADNPNNPFTAFLISPSGEALGTASNTLPDATSPTGTDQENGAQVHVLSPAAGTWTLIVAFIPQVSGDALAEPFTVSTSQSTVPAAAQGLPNDPSTQLPVGQPVTVNVRVTNDGPSAEAYFIDARLPRQEQMFLISPTSPDTTAPLNVSENLPIFIVPTQTTAVIENALTNGSTPIQFDSAAPAGDPDLQSTTGLNVTATLGADRIAQGLWDIAPTTVGPFGPTGASPEYVHTSMMATAAAFDPSVSSQTGDLWQAAVSPNALNTFSPVIVPPGQTVSIPVTITPSGLSGTRDSGTLYVDDANALIFGGLGSPGGDEIASFPYAYSVK